MMGGCGRSNLFSACFTPSHPPPPLPSFRSLSSVFAISGYVTDQGGVVPTNPTDWYPWVLSVISLALPAAGGVDPLLPNAVLGGVRLAQSRYNTYTGCSLSPYPDLEAAINTTACYSGASFMGGWEMGPVTGVSPVSNDTVDVASAFTPYALPTGASGQVFQYVLTSAAAVAGDTTTEGELLQGAGWVDPATASTTVEIATLNLNAGYWARLLFVTNFAPGGTVTTTGHVTSLPINPYQSTPGLTAIDVIVVLYIALSLLLLLRSTLKNTCKMRRAIKRGDSTFRSCRRCADSWYLVELLTGTAMLVTLFGWLNVIDTLSHLRAVVAAADWTAFPESSTAVTHAALEAAVNAAYAARVEGIVALLFLTVRLGFLASLQPKLGIMTDTLSRSLDDMLHFSVVLGVMLAFFGVWGHIFFGAQESRFTTPSSSAWGMMSLIECVGGYRLRDCGASLGVFSHPLPPSQVRLQPRDLGVHGRPIRGVVPRLIPIPDHQPVPVVVFRHCV